MKLAVFVLLLVVLPLQASSYVCDTLIVEVMKGADVPHDGPWNFADAYVKAKVDGQAKYTRVIDENPHPKFYEDLKFTNVKSDKLVVEMWDEDGFLQGGDDLVRTCVEKIKLGSRLVMCGEAQTPQIVFAIHCLKGNMKRKIFNPWMRRFSSI